MKNNKISIIVPAYNVEEYIAKCIESLINQTFRNIEIIVIDDGSTDNTGLLIDQYAKKDPRIVVIHQKNGGLPKARNTGLDKAKGEFIMFLDSDDWLEENCCEVVFDELEREKLELLFFEYSKEYKNKTVPMKTYQQEKLYYNAQGEKDFFLYDMRTITAWGKIYSAELIGEQRFNENMRTAEDVDFNFHIYEKVNRAKYINQHLLHYRILNQSAIHGFDSQIYEKLSFVLKSLRNWAKKDKEHEEAYYSFLAISFILVCQNGICLNKEYGFWKKVKKSSELKSDELYRELFQNIEKIRIPITRKMIVILAKLKLWPIVMTIICTKQFLEKRS